MSTLEAAVDPAINRTALILVGQALGNDDFQESQLYACDYDRRFRPQSADSPFADNAAEDV